MHRYVFLALVFVFYSSIAAHALDVNYSNSAHGNQASRSDMPSAYVTGNCAHCHLQHGSVEGTDGSAYNYALFSTNFSDDASWQYVVSDNVCFHCHTDGEVINYEYSKTFGGHPVVENMPTSVLGQFNLSGSFHDLENIQAYAENRFDWFTSDSNPCVACHNPHLARDNNSNVADPLYTAISRPSAHKSLWGDNINTDGDVTVETMEEYGDNSYHAPYSYDSTITYEPGGLPDSNPSTVPDYPTFCNECHGQSIANQYSNNFNRDLRIIDWGAGGDKHGTSARTGDTFLRPPFMDAYGNSTSTNYVLSCMDCHEAHGSPEPFLVRRSINGEDLASTSGLNDGRGNQCRQCHQDDSEIAGGSGTPNDWRQQHHGKSAVNPPYGASQYSSCGCHPSNTRPPPPIECDICHYHGSYVPNPSGVWPANANTRDGSTRKTF